MRNHKRMFRSLAVAGLVVLLSIMSGIAVVRTPACAPGAPNPAATNVLPCVVTLVGDSLNALTVQAQVTPEEHYHRVFEIVRDNFLYQDRLKNFSTWEHKYRGQLKTQADAERAINEMLDSLGDGYTYFRNQRATATKATQTAATNVVTYQMMPGTTIGYIKIKTFGSSNAASETEAALKALNKAGATAYVLDLRDNGGGYINQAFSIFAMFVDSGQFATIKGTKDGKPYLEELTVTARHLEDKENGKATTSRRVENLTGGKPVVLLVNGSSASASEMLAGALRDHGRAELVGTRTFGKGIAQLNINLAHNTSMQVTFASLNQPAGGNIHGKGMTPDHVVSNRPRLDDQLQKAVEVAKDKVNNP